MLGLAIQKPERARGQIRREAREHLRERTNEPRLTRGRRTSIRRAGNKPSQWEDQRGQHVLREESEEDTARLPKVDSCRAPVYNDVPARARTRDEEAVEGMRGKKKRETGEYKEGKRTSRRSRRAMKWDAMRPERVEERG